MACVHHATQSGPSTQAAGTVLLLLRGSGRSHKHPVKEPNVPHGGDTSHPDARPATRPSRHSRATAALGS
jgi:hypothetical protein